MQNEKKELNSKTLEWSFEIFLWKIILQGFLFFGSEMETNIIQE